jgi:hypothetical protein
MGFPVFGSFLNIPVQFFVQNYFILLRFEFCSKSNFVQINFFLDLEFDFLVRLEIKIRIPVVLLRVEIGNFA